MTAESKLLKKELIPFIGPNVTKKKYWILHENHSWIQIFAINRSTRFKCYLTPPGRQGQTQTIRKLDYTDSRDNPTARTKVSELKLFTIWIRDVYGNILNQIHVLCVNPKPKSGT